MKWAKASDDCIMVRNGNSPLYDINLLDLSCIRIVSVLFPVSKCSAAGWGEANALLYAVSQGKEAERGSVLIPQAGTICPESKTESCFCG